MEHREQLWMDEATMGNLRSRTSGLPWVRASRKGGRTTPLAGDGMVEGPAEPCGSAEPAFVLESPPAICKQALD